MAITIEHGSTRAANWLRLRQALALPLYTISLILSFLGDGFAKLAAMIAGDPH